MSAGVGGRVVRAKYVFVNAFATTRHVGVATSYASVISIRRLSASTRVNRASFGTMISVQQLVRTLVSTSCRLNVDSLNIESLPLNPWSEPPEPLRILFCGSDELSVTVLRALHKEQLANRSLIESISVFHRPAKATGRGLKKRTIPVLKTVAQELGIKDVYEGDTFTGWSPPEDKLINLIIAVSFGLFVPPRILNGAKYRGLNIHPSLLPDLRGCSPIQSAIIHGDKETGITLQDLNPKLFDHGRILARVRLRISRPDTITNSELTSELAEPAAKLLLEGLKRGLYQHERAQELPEVELGQEPREAVRFKKDDMQLCEGMSARKAVAIKRALGQLWFIRSVDGGEGKRCLLDGLSVVEGFEPEDAETKKLVMEQLNDGGGTKAWTVPVAKDKDEQSVVLLLGNKALRIETVMVSGGKNGSAVKAFWAK